MSSHVKSSEVKSSLSTSLQQTRPKGRNRLNLVLIRRNDEFFTITEAIQVHTLLQNKRWSLFTYLGNFRFRDFMSSFREDGQILAIL